MNTSPSAIQFPAYNAEKAQVLSQHKFALYLAKIKVGTVPVNKFSDAEKTIPIKSPCWEWTAYKNKDGYGYFKLTAGRTGRAHRVSAFLAGLTGIKSQYKNDKVLHKCDNPACVNPDHFFIGTQKNNVDDMVAKNRQAPQNGEENGAAKLNWNQVKEIRERYKTGGITTYKLANDYGVSHFVIGRIVHNEGWFDPNYTPHDKRAQSPFVFLTAEQRAEVIKLYAIGNTSTRKLAKQFGVVPSTIYSIIKKESK